MNEINTFPSNKSEALAMLYIQSRKNLSEMTAVEILEEYEKAYYAIRRVPKKTPAVQTGNVSI